jgi:23S rRNA (adenine2503-C2)-methyltransferase
MGFRRNLTAAEIINQLIAVRRVLHEGEVTNVVLMGMGEPLLNYENVIRAVRLMGLEMGISLGARKITVSTAGIVPGIYRLATEGLRMGLAISLNAADEATRGRLMPIHQHYPLASLMEAVRTFSRTCDRRVTFEYVLIQDVNDSLEDARQLVRLISHIPCKVNLIPLNPIPDSDLRRPSPERIERFQQFLFSRHFTAILRASKGEEIAAACGQLCVKS